MDENEKLEKREVRIGRIMYGSMVEVLSGLTYDDYVAFPYGKNIKSGAKAVVSDLSTLYEGFYY